LINIFAFPCCCVLDEAAAVDLHKTFNDKSPTPVGTSVALEDAAVQFHKGPVFDLNSAAELRVVSIEGAVLDSKGSTRSRLAHCKVTTTCEPIATTIHLDSSSTMARRIGLEL
jgi:hypothetical protein